MSHRRRAAALLLLGATLASCGLNRVRLDDAATVVRESRAATDGSRLFLDRVAATRIDADIELVAVDPACGRADPVLRAMPRLAQAHDGAGALCLLPGEAAGAADSRISLRPIDDGLRPTLALVDALAAYGEALALVVEHAPADPLVPVAKALESARAAQALLTALDANAPGPIPAADDPRLIATRNLVALLIQLQQEAAQVGQLRRVLAGHPDGAAPVIAALRGHLDAWELARKGDAGLRAGAAGAAVRLVLDRQPPATPDDRRNVLRSFYAQRAVDQAESGLFPALVDLLAALGQSDADLRRLLRPGAPVTKAERARIAEIDRQRVVAGLNALAAVARSFAGR